MSDLPFENVFAGRRVLVTGHTGFKGSWLCAWLLKLGADVTGFALPPATSPCHFDLLGLEGRMRHIVGDLRDPAAVMAAVEAAKPEIVFHMAAQALVRYSYDEPVETFDTNVMGTVHVLDAVRRVGGVKVVINITSDKAYDNKEWIWGYRENDPMGGRDPYSASKGAAELVFHAYAQSFLNPAGILSASVRAGNVVGGGDWAADRIIPDCIRAIERGEPVFLRNPTAVRPWQHVLEPLGGYMMVAAKLMAGARGIETGEGWNFGPSARDCQPVIRLAEAVVAHWGKGSVEVAPATDAKHEAHLLRLNCDKSNNILGWWPAWRFEDTMRETVGWYKAWSEGRPVWDITMDQIAAYERAFCAANAPEPV
jgi:CDP-glucose 4,6-dehydratase